MEQTNVQPSLGGQVGFECQKQEWGNSGQPMGVGWAGEGFDNQEESLGPVSGLQLRMNRRQAEMVFWKTQFVRQDCGIICAKGDPEAAARTDCM